MRVCLRYSTVTNDVNGFNAGLKYYGKANCSSTIILDLQTRGGPPPFGADTT